MGIGEKILSAFFYIGPLPPPPDRRISVAFGGPTGSRPRSPGLLKAAHYLGMTWFITALTLYTVVPQNRGKSGMKKRILRNVTKRQARAGEEKSVVVYMVLMYSDPLFRAINRTSGWQAATPPVWRRVILTALYACDPSI